MPRTFEILNAQSCVRMSVVHEQQVTNLHTPNLHLLGYAIQHVARRPVHHSQRSHVSSSDHSTLLFQNGIRILKPVWTYLQNYGYADGDQTFSSDQLTTAVKRFAKDVGHSDESSLTKLASLMKKSRCSQRYEPDEQTHMRKKRFVAHIEKWQFNELTWRFRDPFALFKESRDFEIVRQTLQHALDMWSQASGRSLKFIDRSYSQNSTVDIDTFFAVGFHGDHEAFDGRGGIVAHSGYPMVGKIHFDADELWTIDGDKGVDLRYVTLHETGHALGLRHSKNQDAIMYPIYRKNPNEIALSDDDTSGIQYLYKAKAQHTKRYRRPDHRAPLLDFENL